MIAEPLVAVSTEIGQGHPAYLDAVLAELDRLPSPYRLIRLPGTLPWLEGAAWLSVRLVYQAGGLGGPATALYNRLRAAGKRPAAWQLDLLGRTLGRELAGFKGVCLVEHPLVARILAPVCRVAYLHAEIAAPAAAAVPEAWRTLVPLDATAHRLQAAGARRSGLVTTGLVFDSRLVAAAESAFEARLARLGGTGPLTVGLFTSGAWPRPHVSGLVAAARSLRLAGHQPLVFAGSNERRAARLRRRLARVGVPAEAVLSAPTRAEHATQTVEQFPRLDLIVAAAHERTCWAVGLGLPFFILGPDIGPFAPLNREFALEQGVGEPFDPATAFGGRIARLRIIGVLAGMARAGWGRHPIDGAAVAVASLR